MVYCTLGVRSEVVANELIERGYRDVKNLYGGISEWKNKDYVVVDSTQTPTENIHVYSKKWGKWLTKGNPSLLIYEKAKHPEGASYFYPQP